MGSSNPYMMIPTATQAVGQNNTQGGIQNPYGGSGMDLNNAQRILDPLGIGGGGGMNKSAAEAFFDPAGIDSGPFGLNLFGHRPDPNANGIPSVLPNLGAASLIPQLPQGRFQNFSGGIGPYNQMAAQSMGGQMFNPAMQTIKGGQPNTLTPKGAVPTHNFDISRNTRIKP